MDNFEGMLQEAERLATLGFYGRARKLIEPYVGQYSRADEMLARITQMEANFEHNRNIYRFDPTKFLPAVMAGLAAICFAIYFPRFGSFPCSCIIIPIAIGIFFWFSYKAIIQD